MVWIFFLSTNRNFFQRNQLGINYKHPPSDRNCKETPSIFSKSNLLELFSHSHISVMLYHIVSEAYKLGQFRWSGFFSYQQTGTTTGIFSTESTRGIHPRTGTAKKLHLSFPNRIFWNFSHKPHFRNAISHSVRSFKIRSIPMVWIFFLSTNRNFFQRNQLVASTLGPELQRNSIYLFQIESSGTFLTSHISAMLYHIVSEA